MGAAALSRREDQKVDPRGPVFVSYRSSDGGERARWCAEALRAHGVPAWHDESDLLTSEFTRSLETALGQGLSGAVVVATAESRKSGPVRNVELPAILKLAEDPAFVLLVANAVADGEPGDYSAPDQLLGVERGTLSNVKQMPLTSPEDADAIARQVATARSQRINPVSDLEVDVQTRVSPHSLRGDGLVVRLGAPYPGESLPPKHSIERLASFLSVLPELVERSGATGVMFLGGAHLSVAFCFGAALPATLNRVVRITDHQGNVWGDARTGNIPAPKVVPHEFGRDQGPVAALIDVHPEQAARDAFSSLMDSAGDLYSAAIELRVRTEVDANAGAALATALARRIRSVAASHRTEVVHLCLRTPWPLALLIGREFNTFEVLIHEFERPDTYRPVACIKSGMGGGPITSIPER